MASYKWIYKFLTFFKYLILFKMLELKLEQGNALKKIIEAIKEIIKEVNLNITKKGIFI